VRRATSLIQAAILLCALAGPLQAQGGAVAGQVPEAQRPWEEGSPASRQVNPFHLFLSTTVHGGLAVGGTCIGFLEEALGGPYGGPLTLDGVPPGAGIHRAYLYWSVLSADFPVPTGTPTFDGHPVLPVPLGTVPRSPCFPQPHTGTFRADVTSWVRGNGTYVLDGFPGDATHSDLTEGATLFVVYCHPDAPLQDVVIWEGVDVINMDEPVFEQTIGGFQANPVGDVSAYLAAAVGNGQWLLPGIEEGSDPFYFNREDLDSLYPEILSGGLCGGLYYDLTAYDVSEWVQWGALTADLRVEVRDDCYTFAALALAVTTNPLRPDDCEGGICGGTILAPDSVSSCDGSPVGVSLASTFPDCPAGPTLGAVQATDPLTAINETLSSDLEPDLTAGAVHQATLTVDLTGDTDLTACVEIALIDPGGTPQVVKALGEDAAGSYDVTSGITGPGLYRVRLRELDGCGAGPNQFATLTGAALDVVEDTGRAPVEYRVERADGPPVCDWGDGTLCGVPPDLCPGSEMLTASARCTFEPACIVSQDVEFICSRIESDFTFEPPCGDTEACFQAAPSGAYGNVRYRWDMAGEGNSALPDICWTFSGGPPWDVTLQATDEARCSSQVTKRVYPDTGDPPEEPSALDQDPSAPPLRVARPAGRPGELALAWEEVRPGAFYNLYRGEIGDYYSHGAFARCGIMGPGAVLALEGGSHYYLATGINCNDEESSYGRRSGGSERPDASGVAPCF